MCDSEQDFFKECQRGNVSKITKLIEGGIDINVTGNLKDGKEMSALCVAAYEGHLEVVKLLLKSANINYRCKQGESPLFLAAQQGHAKIVQCILEAGASLLYTAKPGDKVLFKNWEVFSQALHHAYPHNIDHPKNQAYKSVVQVLVDYNAESSSPSVIYEALFCELTVFANPMAVYTVGVYAAHCPEHIAVVFCEENFLNALCRAYSIARSKDFIRTAQTLLDLSKLRQKDTAHGLVKFFNWAELLRQLAEEQQQKHGGLQKKALTEILQSAVGLMRILQILIGNFNVRSDLMEQFRPMTIDDMGKIGRLLKSLLEYEIPCEDTGSHMKATDSEHKNNTWKIIFFLLKHQLRSGQDACVARFLLRSVSSDYEKKVLLMSLDDNLSLAHMLLDFGVPFSGECLVRSIQCGHLDLINRFKANRELLFCKEVEEIMRQPLLVKNSSNRNMRRCLKIVRGQRSAMEEERRKFENELLNDAELATAKPKHKRKSRGKKNKSVGVIASDEHCTDTLEEELVKNIQDGAHEEEPVLDPKTSVCHAPVDSHLANGHGDHSASLKSQGSKGKKNKKRHANRKHSPSQLTKKVPEEKETTPQQEMCAEELKRITLQNRWNDVAVVTARRRRQSSSSSDCSIGSGSRKSVHFSHQLVSYENTNKRDSQPLKHNGNKRPTMSNLKRTCLSPDEPLLSETYRTNPLNGGEMINCNSTTNGFGDLDSDIPWIPISPRWAPRFEDLSEMDTKDLKGLKWLDSSNKEHTVYICDNQKHLLIGTGPDFSSVFLSITDEGQEVAVKRINPKRAPLLAQKDLTDRLVDIPECTGLTNYLAAIKDKTQCFLVQTVGEFNLEQIFRRKMATLTSAPEVLCHQLAVGLCHLHRNNVLHMAIKPNNVLLCSDGQLRLADYGIHCRQTSSNQKHTLGPTSASVCWMAHEVLSSDSDEKQTFSETTDVASLGMVFYYILTEGNHPFGDPNTVPGVCISNINRGAYNLKSITDPFAHHLIRNMIVKESEKRITMEDVVGHPFFWNSEKKEKFVMALTETSLSSSTVNGSTIMHQLKPVELAIMSSYANQEKLTNIADIYRVSVRGLLTLLYDCVHNDDLYAQCTLDADREEHPSVASYFTASFPGLLLHTYKLFTLECLEKVAVDCALESPPSSPDDKTSPEFLDTGTDNSLAPSIASDATEDQDAITEEDLQVHTDSCEIPQTPVCDVGDIAKQSRASPQTNVLPNLLMPDSTQPKDKKNPSLCLAPPPTLQHCSDPPDESLERSCLLSPEASDCMILNEDSDWAQQSSSSDQEQDVHPGGEADCLRKTVLVSKAHSSHNNVDIYPEVGSPDDWIEIGSPLEEQAKTKPVAMGKSESANSSPSSGCSVDECFEFGSFGKSDAESPTDVQTTKNRIANGDCGFHEKHFNGHELATTCTDIDELD